MALSVVCMNNAGAARFQPWLVVAGTKEGSVAPCAWLGARVDPTWPDLKMNIACYASACASGTRFALATGCGVVRVYELLHTPRAREWGVALLDPRVRAHVFDEGDVVVWYDDLRRNQTGGQVPNAPALRVVDRVVFGARNSARVHLLPFRRRHERPYTLSDSLLCTEVDASDPNLLLLDCAEVRAYTAHFLSVRHTLSKYNPTPSVWRFVQEAGAARRTAIVDVVEDRLPASLAASLGSSAPLYSPVSFGSVFERSVIQQSARIFNTFPPGSASARTTYVGYVLVIARRFAPFILCTADTYHSVRNLSSMQLVRDITPEVMASGSAEEKRVKWYVNHV
jgi:hypothetical protein